MKVRSQSRLKFSRVCKPILEVLEERLPPGDAGGAVAAWYLSTAPSPDDFLYGSALASDPSSIALLGEDRQVAVAPDGQNGEASTDNLAGFSVFLLPPPAGDRHNGAGEYQDQYGGLAQPEIPLTLNWFANVLGSNLFDDPLVQQFASLRATGAPALPSHAKADLAAQGLEPGHPAQPGISALAEPTSSLVLGPAAASPSSDSLSTTESVLLSSGGGSILGCNDPPQVDAGPDTSGLEGQTITIQPSFTAPPGSGPFDVTVDWGDGSFDSFFFPEPTTFSASHVYEDDDLYLGGQR